MYDHEMNDGSRALLQEPRVFYMEGAVIKLHELLRNMVRGGARSIHF